MMNTKKLRMFVGYDLKNEDIPHSLRMVIREMINAIEIVDGVCCGHLGHKDAMPIQSLSVLGDFKIDMIAYIVKLSTLAICNEYEKTKAPKSDKEEEK